VLVYIAKYPQSTTRAVASAVNLTERTVHDDSEHILSILEAGAAGYLTKSVFGEEVVHTVRGVVAGETVLSASISQQIIKGEPL